ncbi:MAG: GspE/PulE family protein [Patescibacteria group bacterium]|nr:GspE/PulE family protein [Patescibacteria group bacterium]MDD4610856.1 GspE/PulE family protein [Patescibacteria group bacterium]
MEKDKEENLLKTLVSEGKASAKEISELQKVSKIINKSLEELLIQKKIVDAEELAKIKAKLYRMSYVSLLDKDVSYKVLNIISREAAENYKVVCFEKTGAKIKVGITDAENFKAIEAINFLAKEEKLEVQFYLISQASFDKIIKQYTSLSREITSALETKAKIEAEEAVKTKKETKEERGVEEIIESAPVTKIVSVIIRHAVEGRASDIHIEPFYKESRVRYRIDGVLHTSLILPRNIHSAIVARIKVMANLKLDETRLPQDGRIRLMINDKAIDFRVSILPLMGDEKVVMRILDVTKGAPTLEELGYSGRILRVVKDNIKKPSGMFLITGPTGSGKSTTLFAILNMINTEGMNICTLEDPVEYFVKGVNQSQIRPEIGFSFANGLRSLLRQDPDVVMVGEIRDNETAELAIHAGLTGHFVLSTLHTNDALGAIPRLMDMKVEPFLLGSTLNLVAAQRLARKICPYCKVEDKLPKEVIDDIKAEIKNMPEKIVKEDLSGINIDKVVFYKGKGCSRCGNSGYSGRVAVVEAIEVNDQIRSIIVEGVKNLKTEDIKNNQDFTSMKQDGIIKAIKGDTTIEEIMRVIKD